MSWKFPKLTIYLLILLLTAGCPLIHKYSTNSPCCATTASAWLLLTELLKVDKPTCQLHSSSDTPILYLPSVRTHSLGRRSFSYAAPSVWKLSLARLDHQTHSPLWNIFEISPLKLSYWLCVCVCVCTCLQKFVLTVFCSLLCDGLCAPIWRNSTWKSTLLLFVMCVPKYTHMLRVHLRWNYLQNKGWLNGVCRGVCKSICLTLSQNNPQFCDC